MSFKCPLCTESTDLIATLLHLHVHCINAHPNQFHSCAWCSIPYRTIRDLKDHAKNCLAFDKNDPREGKIDPLLVNGHQCLVCVEKFPSNEAAIKHYKEQHLHFSYICGECQQYFQRKSALESHRATAHAWPIQTRESSLPSEYPSTSSDWEQNAKRSASIAFNRNLNEDVNAPTAKKRKIISENGTFADKRLFMLYFNQNRCVDCEMDFLSTADIVTHFKIEHQMAVFVCSCSKAYLSETAMHLHRRRRLCKKSPEQKDVSQRLCFKREYMKFFNQCHCIECKRQFANTKETAEHLKVEHCIDVWLCDICLKGFLWSNSLPKHRKRVHKINQNGSHSFHTMSRADCSQSPKIPRIDAKSDSESDRTPSSSTSARIDYNSTDNLEFFDLTQED